MNLLTASPLVPWFSHVVWADRVTHYSPTQAWASRVSHSGIYPDRIRGATTVAPLIASLSIAQPSSLPTPRGYDLIDGDTRYATPTVSAASSQSPGRSMPLVMVTVVVLLSRLPFIAAGYGVDPDAWRWPTQREASQRQVSIRCLVSQDILSRKSSPLSFGAEVLSVQIHERAVTSRADSDSVYGILRLRGGRILSEVQRSRRTPAAPLRMLP